MKIKLSKGNNKISISLILLLFAFILLLNNSCGDSVSTKRLSELAEHLAPDDITEIRALIESGADVDVVINKYGGTILYVAVVLGYTEIVKILLDADADVNIPDLSGVAMGGKYSVIVDDESEILRLLGVGGATPLWWASMYGRTEITKLLLKAKADVNIPDKTNGVSPIYVAASDGHTHIVRLLIESNANLNIA